MIISANALKKAFSRLGAFVLAIFAGSSAHAQILLEIQYVTPTEITITATGSPISATTLPTTTGDYDINYGIDLENFFSTPQSQSGITTAVGISSLVPVSNSASLAFDQAANDDYTGAPHEDLNIFGASGPGVGTISFSPSTTISSFTTGGTLTLDLSQLTTTPQSNASGSILAGYSPGNSPATLNPDVVIGSWEVVQAPEPSTWVLLAGSVLLLPLVRRFRRA